MKKVLLLGDSIRMGYDSMVREMLEGEYEVFYDDNDNGRFTTYTLWQANQLIRKYGYFDVIHWNNGYWDMHTEAPMQEPICTIPEYTHMLRKILRLLRQNSNRVIFATSLPVPAADTLRSYDNDTVIAYNAAALEVMHQEHVEVNDLYEMMYSYDGFLKCEDGVHLTQEGYHLCAEQIARIIRKG